MTHFNEVTKTQKEGLQQVRLKVKMSASPFQKFLTELKKPTDAHELNIKTKRLYGKMMHQFLQDLDNVNKPNLASVESVDYVNAEESKKS